MSTTHNNKIEGTVEESELENVEQHHPLAYALASQIIKRSPHAWIRSVTVNNYLDAMQSVYYSKHSSSYGCSDVVGNIFYDFASCTIVTILPLSIAITQTIRSSNWDPFDFNTIYATGHASYPNVIVIVAWLWASPS